MASSRPEIIPFIVYKLMEMKPKTILDVGTGYGKWGLLCVEYLKYWCGVTPVVDGVEAFPDYASPAHKLYRQMYYTSVLTMLPKLADYELVLCTDVIEHMTREDGERFKNAIKGRYIISTPNYWNPQEATDGNEFDKHQSLWHGTDFENHAIVGGKYIIGWR